MAPPAERPAGLTNLQKRTLSAAVLLPVAVAAIMLGAPWFNILIAVFAVAMAWEWTSVVATVRSSVGHAFIPKSTVVTLKASQF